MIGLDARRDRSLLRAVAAGQPAALRDLFERYAPACTALAHRIIGDPMLAEDVVQEAFLSLWERAAAYQAERGSVRSYLFSVVHHRAVDRVRREAAQQRHAVRAATMAPPAEPALDEAVVEAADLRQRRAAVRAALAAIPAEQRQIIEMMYFEGVTQREIAERLGLPLGTVKSRTLLGMRKLHSALTVEGGEAG